MHNIVHPIWTMQEKPANKFVQKHPILKDHSDQTIHADEVAAG